MIHWNDYLTIASVLAGGYAWIVNHRSRKRNDLVSELEKMITLLRDQIKDHETIVKMKVQFEESDKNCKRELADMKDKVTMLTDEQKILSEQYNFIYEELKIHRLNKK